VGATVDPSIGEDCADVTVITRDGRRLRTRVEHAIGSLERPMTDVDLEIKFHGLVDPILGRTNAKRLIDACEALWSATEVRTLTELVRP